MLHVQSMRSHIQLDVKQILLITAQKIKQIILSIYRFLFEELPNLNWVKIEHYLIEKAAEFFDVQIIEETKASEKRILQMKQIKKSVKKAAKVLSFPVVFPYLILKLLCSQSQPQKKKNHNYFKPDSKHP